MAKLTGGAASFTFNAVTYTAADCIQDWSYGYTVDGVAYQCSNYNQMAVGANNVTATATLAIDAADTALLAALLPGTTAADFEFHPFGDTITYIEIASTDAVLLDRSMSGSSSSVVLISLAFHLNNVSEGAAA